MDDQDNDYRKQAVPKGPMPITDAARIAGIERRGFMAMTPLEWRFLLNLAKRALDDPPPHPPSTP